VNLDIDGTLDVSYNSVTVLSDLATGWAPAAGDRWCLSSGSTYAGFPEANYIDNVTIASVPIPEPATLALLDLGAFGMLFGRRRTRKS
jgi:hypothetical protein